MSSGGSRKVLVGCIWMVVIIWFSILYVIIVVVWDWVFADPLYFEFFGYLCSF